MSDTVQAPEEQTVAHDGKARPALGSAMAELTIESLAAKACSLAVELEYSRAARSMLTRQLEVRNRDAAQFEAQRDKARATAEEQGRALDAVMKSLGGKMLLTQVVEEVEMLARERAALVVIAGPRGRKRVEQIRRDYLKAQAAKVTR